MFEEQEGDFKVHFEDEADLGMAADIQWPTSRQNSNVCVYVWMYVKFEFLLYY